MGIKERALYVFDVHCKKLLLASIIVVLLACGSLFVNYVRTGEVIQKGVSLTGGLVITMPVQHSVSLVDLQAFVSSAFPSADITVRSITKGGTITAIIVEAAGVDATQLLSKLKQFGIPLEEGTYSVEDMGSSLGNDFFNQAGKAIVFAFVLMAIVVFITFRVPVPSMFVVLAAASDVIVTLAIISLLNVRLSSAGIAAFLMLIGYSVDTDILLTSRVLRRTEGTVLDRILDAMRTGLLMTTTTIVATLVGYFLTQSSTIQEIMLILLIGSIVDVFMTWIQNAAILRWYLERKHAKA